MNNGYVKGLEGETTVKLSVNSITWSRLKPYFLNPNIKQHNYNNLSCIILFQSVSITTPTTRIIQDSKNKMHAANM